MSSSPLQLTPSLVESQIQRIADTAETLIKAMSQTVEAKQLKNNKKVSKEVEVITVFLIKNYKIRHLQDVLYVFFECYIMGMKVK